MELFAQQIFKRHRRSAWLVLGLSLVLALLANHALYLQTRKIHEQEFDLHVQDVLRAINARMRRHEQILLGGAGLFDASQTVSRDAWRTYVARLKLERNYPGIQGVGYAQIIPPEQLGPHTRAIQAEGFPLYTVRPAGERALYTAIIYLEPFRDRNLAAFGYDMFSEPTRARAMRSAGESGETAITAKVKLVQETHGKAQAGFLMYVPVYRKNQPLGTPQERWNALQGFVYSPYRVDDLMHGLRLGGAKPLSFRIFDGLEESEEALMYDAPEESPGPEASASPQFTVARTIEAYGRNWTVRFRSRAGIEDSWWSPQSLMVLAAGGGFSLLLFVLVSFLSSRREQAEALAQQMTAEIRRNEEELRQSEARLNEAQHTAHLGSWELDLSTGHLHWSDEIFRLFEIDKTRFVATYEGFLNATHPDDRDTVNRAYTESLVTRQPYDITHRLRMTDGRIKWVHERCFTEFGADGKPLRSRGTVQDITQLAEAERAAQESARFTQSILDHAVDGIITIDDQGVVQSFNRAAEHIFGHAASEVVGRNVNMLMPEPYHSQHDGYLKNYRDGGAPRIIGIKREVEGRRRDGAIFPMDLAVSRSEHQGRPLFIGLVRDITERRRIEKMKTEFVSTVSHELRTPLTSIRGALGLVSGGALGPLPEQIGAMLKIASNNTERLLLLINDILDMQKIESGQMAFRFTRLEVMPFMRQTLRDLANYGEQHGVKFAMAKEVEGVHVYADPDRLGQVLSNLLSNAAKFSPAGETVVVAVARHEERLRISVTDHGPGIPEAFQPRLFERFTQADSSDSRRKGGTGLGLAITKAIVEKHGGHISFITREGIGTSFLVDLPLLSGSQAAAQGGHSLRQRSPASVLIVEDDPDVAALIQRMLAEAGLDSDIAYDAAQARALLARSAGAYKLMTLDIVLPGEGGLRLLDSLRQDAATRQLPVVVLSVKADDAKRELNGGAIGVVDWLCKPIDQQRLMEVVRQATRPGRLPRVLHVEDDPDIHRVVRAMLGEQCELVSTTTLVASREALRNQPFDLVLLDVGLPDGSGLDLLEAIERGVRPPKVVIFSAQEVSQDAASRVSAALVKARTGNEALLNVLMEALGHG